MLKKIYSYNLKFLHHHHHHICNCWFANYIYVRYFQSGCKILFAGQRLEIGNDVNSEVIRTLVFCAAHCNMYDKIHRMEFDIWYVFTEKCYLQNRAPCFTKITSCQRYKHSTQQIFNVNFQPLVFSIIPSAGLRPPRYTECCSSKVIKGSSGLL